MKLLVGRNPTYYVLKVVIPLCLIVMMSWLPRWINPDQIGTNIGVSTTSFLTLVAYLFAITVLLPRVSYFTRLDRFIFLSILMVFMPEDPRSCSRCLILCVGGDAEVR